MRDIAITEKQLGYMKHAIGYERKAVKRGKYNAYRNRFITNDLDGNWQKLVENGFAEGAPFNGGGGDNPRIYWVTEKGYTLLERILEVKIVREV